MGQRSLSETVSLPALEQLANAQALLPTLADAAETAAFVARTLEQIPGAGRSAVCLVGADGPEGSLRAGSCEHCLEPRSRAGAAAGTCALALEAGVDSFAVNSQGFEFGRVLLALEAREEFEHYRPFVTSFTQAVALALDNRSMAEQLRAEPKGRSRAFLQTVIDAIPEGLMVINRDFSVALANRTARGGERDQLTPSTYCYRTSHGRDAPCDDSLGGCPVTLVLAHKRTISVEHTHIDRQDREHIVEVLAAPVLDEHGEVVQIVESVRDVTERKRAERKLVAALQEKEVLLREIHHRVKNNMQVIVSLLRIHARKFSDERTQTAFAECRERVKAMSLVHEVLYQSKNLACIDFKAYLEKLCRGLRTTHGVAAEGVTITGDPARISLSIDQGIAVGLIVSELVSNAFKHAFPEGQSGSVSIGLSVLDDGQVELIVRDNGQGLPTQIDITNSPSLGLNLVVAAVTGELGGSIEVERASGTRFRILFRCRSAWSGE